MFKIISITDRKNCPDFEKRLEQLSDNDITFILREKDLEEKEYAVLVRATKQITNNFIIHTHTELAKKAGHKKIHLTMHDFMNSDISDFDVVGVSVHSLEEALQAEKMGASYVIYSHIFVTECKKGLEPKGIEKLGEVCKSLSIPVYALGGINTDNISLVKSAGASGACVMSLLMNCTTDECNNHIKGLKKNAQIN